MDFRDNIKCRWISLRRNIFLYIYSTILYVFLAFWDVLNGGYLSNVADYINRYNFQQIMIVFTNICIVLLVINEKILTGYKEFYVLYVGSAKQYFRSIVVLLCIVNIIPFIMGQVLAAIIHIIHNGTFPGTLWLVNLVIVSLEIVTVVLLEVSLVIALKKTLLVCTFYYVIIFFLLVSNNIYSSIPLSISLLETKEYYYTFAYPLWLGKILQVLAGYIIFVVSYRRLNQDKV